MANGPFLDSEGLARVIEQNDLRYVRQVSGKGLSTNDFTDEWKQKIEDLAYEQIAITSFSISGSTQEKGATLSSCVFSFATNKEPKSLVLSGGSAGDVTLDVKARSHTLNEAVTTNKSFTLKATDERDYTASRTCSVNFLNGVYWGVMASTDIATVDSAAILALSKELRGNKNKVFTVNAGADQKIVYAMPESYGTPTFNVGGFDGGFTKVATIEFTNASGYTESYVVYASVNAGLGNTTVTVK